MKIARSGFSCETAVALRLITAKRSLKMMRNKRTMRTQLFLVSRMSRGSWPGESVRGYHIEQEHFHFYSAQDRAAKCGFSSTPASQLAGDPGS
jgi:hypothetical protein